MIWQCIHRAGGDFRAVNHVSKLYETGGQDWGRSVVNRGTGGCRFNLFDKSCCIPLRRQMERATVYHTF